MWSRYYERSGVLNLFFWLLIQIWSWGFYCSSCRSLVNAEKYGIHFFRIPQIILKWGLDWFGMAGTYGLKRWESVLRVFKLYQGQRQFKHMFFFCFVWGRYCTYCSESRGEESGCEVMECSLSERRDNQAYDSSCSLHNTFGSLPSHTNRLHRSQLGRQCKQTPHWLTKAQTGMDWRMTDHPLTYWTNTEFWLQTYF